MLPKNSVITLLDANKFSYDDACRLQLLCVFGMEIGASPDTSFCPKL
jgi:hypothetical protein